MSATGIKLTKSVQNTRVSNAAAEDDEELCNNATNNTTDIAQCDAVFNEENSSSFSHLPSLKEQSTAGDYYAENDALRQNTKVPLATNTGSTHDDAEDDERSIVASQGVDQFNNDPQINSHGAESSQLSPGLSLLQQAAATSSPPPHSYRHSRAYRHFKNPPQPHMCIRTTSETGEELFINVLSWTRIVIPQEPSDPIPLYGGMRVPPGSPRSPPIVFAVMANPEVLKDSGRHSKDPEERRAMVELMCDFVEAMNPGVKLIRNAVILKDRDISGELKDVWNAVQAQRDREREEQMLQQRQQQQQQHYHNLTNGALNANAPQQMFPKSILGGEGTPPRTRKMLQEDVTNEDGINNTSNNDSNEMMMMNTATMSLEHLAEQLDNKMSMQQEEGRGQVVAGEQRDDERLTNKTMSNGNDCKDSLDGNRQQQQEVINQLNANITTTKDLHNNKPGLTNGAMVNINCNITITNTVPEGAALELKTTTMPVLPTTVNTQQNHTTTSSPATTPAAAATPTPTPPTKKEKLGGFLPNGCIFPRFTKNNKHKDKDKEGKTKDKEKNVLLSALKKSKDKKSNNAAATAAAAAAAASNATANQDDKLQQLEQNVNITTTTSSSSSTTTTNTAKQQKNCLQQLECGVQKLDLNHIDKTTTPANNTSTNNSTNTTNSSSNSTGVGVH